MSDDASQDEPGDRPGRKTRGRRGPTPAELALLRWLAAKPRPVTMGPIGHCVKRGWCAPVPTVLEDGDGRRPGFIYIVTEAGSRLVAQHEPDGSVENGPPTAGEADGDEAGDGGGRSTTPFGGGRSGDGDRLAGPARSLRAARPVLRPPR